MCFTININTTRDAIEKRFNVDASALHDFQFQYFYKAFDLPLIPVITQEEPEQIQLMEWGLIPHWANNAVHAEKIRQGTFNARAESLISKASFKEPLKKSRCWIIARGFFEWQHLAGQKIPWYIHTRAHELFAFGGLYDSWRNPDSGKEINSFSIVTTPANPLMEKIHNTKKRMPLILPDRHEKLWLSTASAMDDIMQLLQPYDQKLLHAYTVGKKISLSHIDPNDPELIKAVEYHVDGNLF